MRVGFIEEIKAQTGLYAAVMINVLSTINVNELTLTYKLLSSWVVYGVSIINANDLL